MSKIGDYRAKLLEMLVELGLDPVERGVNGLKLQLSGISTTMTTYGDGTLSLACSVRGGGSNWELERINAANNRIRFAKFSVENGNLLLDADFVFDISSRDAEDQLKQVLHLCQMALRELHILVEQLVAA